MRRILILLFIAGCAHGIVQDVEARDMPEANPAPSVDASSADVLAADVFDGAPPRSRTDAATSCEATPTDDACFDCCDATYPNADDLWFDALEACCPNDECTDDEYDACETKADDACANDVACRGLEACEETSGCWEKVSSGP